MKSQSQFSEDEGSTQATQNCTTKYLLVILNTDFTIADETVTPVCALMANNKLTPALKNNLVL